MTTEKDTIIIFHRPARNAEESIANQQAFLESYRKKARIEKVIDYEAGNRFLSGEITAIGIKQIHLPDKKIISVINSYLSKEEFHLKYEMYCHLNLLKRVNVAELYLMDSEGKIYKEVENIQDM